MDRVASERPALDRRHRGCGSPLPAQVRCRARSRRARPHQRRPPPRSEGRRACSGVRARASSPRARTAPQQLELRQPGRARDSACSAISRITVTIVPSTAPTRLTAAYAESLAARKSANESVARYLAALVERARDEASQDLREDENRNCHFPPAAQSDVVDLVPVSRGAWPRECQRPSRPRGALSERGWCQCRRPAPDRR